jgi:hypothetical protein
MDQTDLIIELQMPHVKYDLMKNCKMTGGIVFGQIGVIKCEAISPISTKGDGDTLISISDG